MRVISQDGCVSVPFDYAIIMVDDNQVVAVTVDSPFNRLMATYRDHEEAMGAMKEMHRRYEQEYVTFRFGDRYERFCKANNDK